MKFFPNIYAEKIAMIEIALSNLYGGIDNIIPYYQSRNFNGGGSIMLPPKTVAFGLNAVIISDSPSDPKSITIKDHLNNEFTFTTPVISTPLFGGNSYADKIDTQDIFIKEYTVSEFVDYVYLIGYLITFKNTF